jgi:hypothetical protein
MTCGTFEQKVIIVETDHDVGIKPMGLTLSLGLHCPLRVNRVVLRRCFPLTLTYVVAQVVCDWAGKQTRIMEHRGELIDIT